MNPKTKHTLIYNPVHTAPFNKNKNSSKPDIYINMSVRCKHLPRRIFFYTHTFLTHTRTYTCTQWLSKVGLFFSVCLPIRACARCLSALESLSCYPWCKVTSRGPFTIFKLHYIPLFHSRTHTPLSFVRSRKAPACGPRRNMNVYSTIYSMYSDLPVYFPFLVFLSYHDFSQ